MCVSESAVSILTAFTLFSVAAFSDGTRHDYYKTIYRLNTSAFDDVCENEKCLPKCCPEGQIFSYNRSCENSDEIFNLSLVNGIYRSKDCGYDNITDCEKIDVHDYRDYFGVTIVGLPNCSKSRIPLEADEFIMMDTDSMVVSYGDHQEFDVTSYCIDLFDNGNITTPISLICLDSDEIVSAAEQKLIHNYYGMFISVAFLIATFLVYALLAELRNLHGKSLMNHCAALGTAYFFLALLQMDIDGKIPLQTCVVFSYVVIFFFLSSFFWLNVMCFDIWWVFSGRQRPVGSRKEIEKKKFIFYSIYSWGLATIIFLIIFIMEMPWIPEHYIRPEFGKTKCWFETKEAEFWYFYLPLAFILSSNLLFFTLTTCRIIKISKETRVLTRGDNKCHEEHERQRFILYIKLFIVMGINWIAELMSFFYPELQDVWYVTDASNTLQGVLIFLIFVWKKRILRLLKLKFRSIFLSDNGLSKTGSKSSNNATNHTSVTSTSDSIKMKLVPTININKTPL